MTVDLVEVAHHACPLRNELVLADVEGVVEQDVIQAKLVIARPQVKVYRRIQRVDVRTADLQPRLFPNAAP